MLEVSNETLLTYAIDRIPLVGESVDCQWLSPHRMEYLDFEGPIGGNQGEVQRVGFGVYNTTDGSGLLKAKEFTVELSFDEKSKEYAKQLWQLRIDDSQLFRVG